ncbi:uncharacterized protein CDAR_64771 [Caerostris darwini]|uniref:Uncharacterized protein n=1 Tax=Caerostris darwini TaxID=1538125 RepID=A0AAV4P2C3_9ARAC|nr:uncharacterized protein CDAR_64771 [Caerostris darwini]
MSGDLQLAIFSHGVGLAKPGMASCFVVWPVAYIRQYLHESTGFHRQDKDHHRVSGSGREFEEKFDSGISTKYDGVDDHERNIKGIRRSATGEGTFQFRTQKGAEIIRELKGIVELWSARKAVLSIQQSSAKRDIFRNSPSKIPPSRGALVELHW